ncbi:MAG: PAS domain S-box protein [Sedimentisphaerales bacterium]|nr:PAS domain S-box protein [Sedimentisphaerales bacterium]
MRGDNELKTGIGELSTKAEKSAGGKDGGGLSLKIFAPAVVFTLVMFGTLTFYAWHSYRRFEIVETQHFRATQLIGIITHLDEVLTMSALMATATGDAKWERRYKEHEPQLEAAIKELREIAPEALMSKAAAQTDAANARLVEAEMQAFELVRAGNRASASALLYGEAYAEQKRIYSDGMRDFTQALQGHMRSELSKHRRQIVIAAAFVAVSVSFVLFVWIGMLQKLKYVSERRSSMKSLRRSESRFKDFFASAAIGYYRTSPGGRILAANPALVRMLGYSSFTELAERDLEADGYEPEYPRVEFKERIEREGQVVGLESAWIKRDGTTLYVIENSRAIRDEHGHVLYYEGTVEDITDRKKAEQELKKFNAIAEKAGYGNAISDLEGNLVYVNESLAEMHGYRAEELTGKHISVFHTEEQLERVNMLTERLLREGSFVAEEVWHKRQDGTVFPALMNGTLIRDGVGKPLFLAATAIDITQRKEAEAALSESEEKYRTLVESAGETIATINRDGVFLFVNKTGAQRLGGNPEDYIGKTMWDLFSKDIADRQMGSVRKAIDTGQGMNFTAQTQLQGQLRWYNTTVEPLRSADGQVTGALIIGRDIHELRQAEMELGAFSEKMTRAERLASFGTLSATLAHELTQPLTVISLAIEDSLAELEGTSCSDTVRDGLRDSLKEVSNVTSIVDRFRYFARKSSEKVVEEVELKAVAERIVKLLNKSAQEAEISLHLKGMEKLPIVYMNEKDLKQLFFALIQNCIQASVGRGRCKLVIDGSVQDKYVELRFADNCGGIEPGDVERVFEPFFTTKAASAGTGLGLCIVQRVAERTGGKVWVENRPGRGSTFVVRLGISGDKIS